MDALPGGSPDVLEAYWSWRAHAACRTIDSALFFCGDGERQRARRVRERRAKAICRTCPVLVPCRSYALLHREPYGIWGGLSEQDRAAIWATDSPGRAKCREERDGSCR